MEWLDNFRSEIWYHTKFHGDLIRRLEITVSGQQALRVHDATAAGLIHIVWCCKMEAISLRVQRHREMATAMRNIGLHGGGNRWKLCEDNVTFEVISMLAYIQSGLSLLIMIRVRNCYSNGSDSPHCRRCWSLSRIRHSPGGAYTYLRLISAPWVHVSTP